MWVGWVRAAKTLVGRTVGTPMASADIRTSALRRVFGYLLCAARIDRPRTNCVACRRCGNGQILIAAQVECRLPANCFRGVQNTSKLRDGSAPSRLCYFESSLDLLMHASTAFTMISSIPHSSNTFTASMVVPPGEQTLIFSCSGESSLSMASLAEPKTV